MTRNSPISSKSLWVVTCGQTLVINSSLSVFDEAVALSTLCFGIYAKSIKNTARVNQELSPLKLKSPFPKAQLANTRHLAYIHALEAKLATWRSGEQVDRSDWTTLDKPMNASAAARKPASTQSATQSQTPVNPVLEGIRSEINSRPQTSTVREKTLCRENELDDQLAKKVSAPAAVEKAAF